MSAQTPSAAASSGQPPTASDLALANVTFLIGSWNSQDGARTTDEHWSSAAGNSMIGTSRTVSGDRTLFYEFLRIESRPDGVYYLAAPMGRSPATPFKLVASSPNALTFENPDHDYPQRILYRLNSAGTLFARIEGTKNGSPASSEWTYIRERQ